MGPLKGMRMIEMAGIGPGPFAGMMFSDLGAEVIRIDRKARSSGDSFDSAKKSNFTDRGRRSIAIDLKSADGVALALELIAQSDALIEGYRPGVMERLGLGPDICLGANPKLVYGRITGWGQHGPLSQDAGHDINYIALIGALHAVGTREAPLPPLNLVGDFGGGAMMLAFGVMAALWEAQRSGRGQVVDAAMTDGAALLMAMMYGFKAHGAWRDTRASNMLDGGAPFYGCYPCADGKFVAVGSLEPQFFEILVSRLGLDAAALGDRWKQHNWSAWRAAIAAAFLTRPRDDWSQVFSGSDGCVTPVLTMEEAPQHPHNVARATFSPGEGGPQPAPAPRFSRTEPVVGAPIAHAGAAILAERGFSESRIAELKAAGAI
jgi:alpha-methylacyl-CoA racemase